MFLHLGSEQGCQVHHCQIEGSSLHIATPSLQVTYERTARRCAQSAMESIATLLEVSLQGNLHNAGSHAINFGHAMLTPDGL